MSGFVVRVEMGRWVGKSIASWNGNGCCSVVIFISIYVR